MNSFVGNDRGQSIVQVLISVGLICITALAFATMIVSQQREMRGLAERAAASDLEKILIASLADGKVCRFVLNNPTQLTFDTTGTFPQVIDIGAQSPSRALYGAVKEGPPDEAVGKIAEVGELASGYSHSLFVKSIRLQIVSGAGANYLANWLVSFDSAKTVRALKPLVVATTLTVDATSPSSAKITGCMEGLGIAQAWRAIPMANGVAYQNTTGKPIQVKATATGFSTWAYLLLDVSEDGIAWNTIDRVSCYDTGTVTATIPDKHYYRASMGGAMFGGPRQIIGGWALK